MSTESPDADGAHPLLEAQIVGICAGEEHRILSANDEFLRLTGYTREELDAGTLDYTRLTPPEWAEASEAASAFTWRHGYCRPYLKEYQRADGTRIEVLVTGALTDRGPRRWVAYVVDMSTLASTLGQAARSSVGAKAHPARDTTAPSADSPVSIVAARNALTELAPPASAPSVRHALIATLDASPTGAMLLAASGGLVHATPRLCALLGTAPTRWTADAWRTLVHPDDRVRLDEALTRLIGGEATAEADSLRWRDGRGGWRTLEAMGARVMHGDELHFVLHMHDREPERRAGREAVRALMTRRALLEAWPDTAAILFDADLRCLTADGSAVPAILAASGTEHVGVLGERLRTWLQAAREGMEQSWTVPASDGRELHCRACALRDTAGGVSGILLAVRALPSAQARAAGA